MLCNKCGAENAETSAFCVNCGATLTAPEAPETPAQEPAPVVDAPIEEIPAQEPISADSETLVAQEPIAEETVEQPPIETVQPEFVPDANAVDPGKGLNIASLVLGIVSLVLSGPCSCCGCLGGIVPSITAILGIILGAVGMKKSKEAGFQNKKGMVGLILSIVALVLTLLTGVIFLIIGGTGMFAEMMDEMSSELYYYY